MWGKLPAKVGMNVKAFCYQFLAPGAPWIWISHIFRLKLLKWFYYYLEMRAHKIFEKNIHMPNAEEYILIHTTF
jgi:hypothetical protein